MKEAISLRTYLFIYGLPLCILLVSIALAMSPLMLHHTELGIGITYDMVITAPFIYFLLIRKRDIPKITVVPFFILGIVLATLTLPSNQQFHLDLIKTYLFPIVELVVLGVVGFKVYTTIQVFKANGKSSNDFYSILKATTSDVLGNPRVANIFASEIAMFYYSLFAWRKPKLQQNQFTCYKDNGLLALLLTVIGVMLVETIVLHMLLIEWNAIVTWVLTGTSIYTAIQLLGHVKALTQRHSSLENGLLKLKYGLFGDIQIPLQAIEKAIPFATEMEESEERIQQLALIGGLESHNIALYFKSPQRLEKIYGITKSCDILLLHIDQKEEFLKLLQDSRLAMNEVQN